MRYLTALAFLIMPFFAFAQDADKIVGIYYVAHQGEESKVKIFEAEDGTYTAQVIWMKDNLDENGEVIKDVKHPDKSKRDTPCDRIILIQGMKYNEKKNEWGEAKVYDPTRGIKANVTCSFDYDTKLRVRGSLLGFGETVFWEKIE